MKRKLMNKQKQRQRMSRRTLLLVAGTFVVAATVTTTIVINLTDSEQSKARDVVTRPVHLVEDLEPVNDFSIQSPVLDPAMPKADQAIFIRRIKPTAHQ